MKEVNPGKEADPTPNISIRKAESGDWPFWRQISHYPSEIHHPSEIDRHASETRFRDKVLSGTGYVVCCNGTPAGIFHYCLLWDSCPFLNCLFIQEEYRGSGLGTAALFHWEQEMKALSYPMVMLSTQVDEEAQHFYRKRGYVDCGGIVFSGTPLDQPMEMVMRKVLG